MSLKVESVDQGNIGLRVEGDLGDLQIIEESSDSDDENKGKNATLEQNTLECIPNNLLQSSSTPVFGSVAVTNSENVQFGNNTFFHGPVTIKQVIQTSTGVDNISYVKTDHEHPTRLKKNIVEANQLSKFKLKTWHKVSITAISILLLGGICSIVLVTLRTDEEHYNTPETNTDNVTKHVQVKVWSSDDIQIMLLSLLVILFTIFFWVFWSVLTNEALQVKKIEKSSTFNCLASSSLNSGADNLIIAPGHLRIVSRTDWLAQPVEEKIDEIRQPVPWVIITHTATEGCFTQSSCVLRVRLIQTFHIESKGWSDISYNFLVGGDGSAYYGRGWDLIGAHTKGYNKYSISIAFIGTFNTEKPTKNQVEACKKLIKMGVAEGKIAKDYKLFGHRQFLSTLSPGDQVFDIIKTWPHFVNTSNADISDLLPNY